MLENSDIRARLKGKVSDAYIEAMIVGIDAWCEILNTHPHPLTHLRTHTHTHHASWC